ncbi:MAG: hypothetical protein WA102_04315 [Candidatus Methanoperedens sp.]
MNKKICGGSMNNKKIVSIASGLSLIALIMFSSVITIVGAVLPANDTGNNIPPEIKVNHTSTIENVPPAEPPIQPEKDVPAVNTPDNKFIVFPREDVIVYFKEMPPSINGFASKYGVTPIFVKPDIKMAAFETLPKGYPGRVSQRTLDIVSELSKDPLIEKAFRDEYRFIARKAGYLVINAETGYYSTEPLIQGPDYYEKLGVEYIPNIVWVGFWRAPPSLEEFASKYGGKLMELSDADNFFMTAKFETSNISEFINNISTDPYVRSVELIGIEPSLASISANNSPEVADTPKASGFESVTSILLLISIIFMMRRR